MIGKITIALIAATVAFIIGVRMISQRAPRPDRIGVANGQLLPCPGTPNCASSFEGLVPISYAVDRKTAQSALMNILSDWPRTEVIVADEDYIHVEFRSRVFSFIDDGEFYIPQDKNAIHFRSAARTGRSDFGVNAGRVEEIREKLQSALRQ